MSDRLTDDERAVMMSAATWGRIWDAIRGEGYAKRVSKAAGALEIRGYIRDDEARPGVHYYRATREGVNALIRDGKEG